MSDVAKLDVAAEVGTILSVPDGELDYARTKLALDKLVAPTVDAEAAISQLDQMADAAARLAGKDAADDGKIAALRQLIYEKGPWNDYRPFGYDHDDPSGTHTPNKLLHNYLASRRGNCVSMPILLLILAEKLGLDVALVTAPQHLFLRHTLPDGRAANLEATSGGHPARDEWYRQKFPMSDRALRSGLYMRPLGRREACALMATTVLEYLYHNARFDDAIGVAEIIVQNYRRAGEVLVAQASAYGQLLEREFCRRFPIPCLIPEPLRSCRLMLIERNNSLLAAAEALGWEPSETAEA